MPVTGDFLNHLLSGHTTIARAWMLRRKDGQTFGFTDHDLDLTFDSVTFKAGTGLTANALASSNGLSVNNTEASGILSDNEVSEADLKAGRFDGAEIQSWIVNWTDVSQRALQFTGSLGEVTMEDGAFKAELRGLTEALNTRQGRLYQRTCSARLGDSACGFDLSGPDHTVDVVVAEVGPLGRLRVNGLDTYAERWFEGGSVTVLSGAASGLTGHVKSDRKDLNPRMIELWERIRGDLQPGDQIRLVTGCDKRAETCRVKFDNFLNYRGFPHIPGEDWLMAYPRKGAGNTGGSRY